MQKRRSNIISILIVPENNAEPYSFRIRTRWVRVLSVLGALLIVHIFLGAIYYWKYANLSQQNHALIAENRQLKEDNKRVVAIEDQFYALERDYQKVKSLLGVEDDYSFAGTNGDSEKETASSLFDNIVPAVKTEPDARLTSLENQGGYFLTPKKSRMHNYAANIPTLLPVKGFLTMDYQKNRWFLPKSHHGIDIAAKKGTVIRAAGAGMIIFSNWTYDLGNLIIIDHGGGILSYYGHCQRILKQEKSYVQKGEPIALLGTSGKSSGPHLHLEIWKDGVPVDPKEYILAFNESVAN